MTEVHRTIDIEDWSAKDEQIDQVGFRRPIARPIRCLSPQTEAAFVTWPWLLGGGALLLLAVAVAFGASQHQAQDRQVMATQRAAAGLRPRRSRRRGPRQRQHHDRHPAGDDHGIRAANIFARTNGYIEKRYVDIGDQVKAGDLLADITAPELDHQIAQAEATLSQNQATLQQTQASRDLARVTNDRGQQSGQAGMAHALSRATTIA